MLITPVIVAKRKNCRGKSVPNLDSEPEETVSEEETNISDVGATDSVKEEQGQKNEEQTSGSKE